MKIKGIDVSVWQGDIDWIKVKNSGIDFAIIRAGFGNLASQKDKKFIANINGALNAGVDVGAYWFSYAYTVEMAKQEARAFLEVMKPYWGQVTYPLYFDWEGDSWRYATQNGVTPTKALISDMALAFMNEIEKGGYWAGNYTNQDYYKNYFDYPNLACKTVWLADYYGEASYPCDIQQYSSTGSVDGIKGNVDCNYCFKDFPTAIAAKGLQGLTPPPAPVEPAPCAECAKKDERIIALGNTISDLQMKLKQRDQDIREMQFKLNSRDSELVVVKGEINALRTKLSNAESGSNPDLAGKQKQIDDLTAKLTKISDILRG